MVQVPTPPASPASRKLHEASPEDNSSPETLDALLERYLHLLDRHQKLQAELGKQLATGFFSLTQANYSCPPGRRYGEDYYDERMKAIRTISIQESSQQQVDEPAPTISSEKTTTSEEKQNDNTNAEDDIDLSTTLNFQLQTLSLADPASKHKTRTSNQEQEQEQEQTQSTSDTSSNDDSSDDSDSNPDPKPTPKASSSSSPSEPDRDAQKPPRNPLTWYGILVPPSLRNAQASFTSAVKGPIPSLAGIVLEMRDVERRVENARRKRMS